MDARLRTFLVRSGFLFLISLVLVAGFWYHREFYQIGFTNLLIEDARRAFLSDLTDADARQAGFRSAAELRETGATRWRWRSSDTVTVLQVRPLGARH